MAEFSFQLTPIDEEIRKDVQAEKTEESIEQQQARDQALAEQLVQNKLIADEQGVDFDFMTAVRNLPESAKGVAADMWHMVTNPVESLSAVGNVAEDMLIKGGRNIAQVMTGKEIEPRNEEAADQFIDVMDERYGSVDNIKRTAMEDPAGVALDALGLAAPARLPTMALRKTAQLGSKVIPKDMPTNMYKSLAKFGTTVPEKDRIAMANTALRERIVPNDKNLSRMDARISQLSTDLDNIITEFDNKGQPIPADKVLQHMNDLRRTKGGVRIGSDSDLAHIDKMVGEFQDLLGGRTTLSAEELQKFKRSAYDDINWNVTNQSGSQIGNDTLKQLARGAKDAVNEAVPGVAKFNDELSMLLEAQPHLARSIARIGNRNTLGIMAPLWGGMVGGGTGGLLGGAGGMAVGAGVQMLTNPKMMARYAIAMDRFRKSDMKWIEKNMHLPEVALIIAGINEKNQQHGQDAPEIAFEQ